MSYLRVAHPSWGKHMCGEYIGDEAMWVGVQSGQIQQSRALEVCKKVTKLHFGKQL